MGAASLRRSTIDNASCHFQRCKALLRTGKRRYIKYHAFAFFLEICLSSLLERQP